MISIVVKDTNGTIYSTCLFDKDYEKLILEKKIDNKDKIVRKICKEFNILPANILSYWVSPD
jgi:hypothetical protein